MVWTRENINNATEYQQTQIDFLRARTLFSLQDAALLVNTARISAYITAFTWYKESRDNRPDLPAGPVPEPSYAMTVIEDQYGNPVEGMSTIRVCPILVYIPLTKPPLVEGLIGKRYYPGNDMYFYALPGDITPNRKRIDGVSADGVKGTFEKYAYIQSSPGEHEIPGLFLKVG